MFAVKPSLTSEQARALASKRRNPGGRGAYRRILTIQSLLMKDIENPKTSAAIRAKCAVALERLEERLRILKGIPLPGMLRPDGDWRTPKKRKPTPVVPLPDVAPKTHVEKSQSGVSLGDRPSPPPPTGGGQNEGVA